jgi:hypothetical protein
LPVIAKNTVKLLNKLILHDVRYIPAFATNIIALIDLRAYRPAYDWKNAEWLLKIGNDTIRVAEESRLWPIYAQNTTEQQNHKQQMTSEQQKISKQEISKQQKISEQKTFEQQTPIPRMSGALISRSGKQFPRRQLRRSKRAQPLWQWHQRLGHLNYEDIKQLESHNFDIKLSDDKALFCEPCTLGKQHTIPSHESQPREEARLDRIHIDIAGGGATLSSTIAQAIEDSEFDYKNASQPSVRDARYFIFIINGYFRYR